MKNFLFTYRCLGNDYRVHIQDENLNKAMIQFAKYYHQIDEIYSIKEENGMKNWDKINVEEILCDEDFYTLFKKLPLTNKEEKELEGYYKVYEAFIDADVKPINAWIATRNIFAIKNQ